MKFARLLIAAVVLAGLGGLVYWSNRSEEAKAGKPDPKAAPKILDLKEADIKQIEIRHRDGETTVVKRDGSGKWSITAPQPLAADQKRRGRRHFSRHQSFLGSAGRRKCEQSSVLWPGAAAHRRDVHHGGRKNSHAAHRRGYAHRRQHLRDARRRQAPVHHRQLWQDRARQAIQGSARKAPAGVRSGQAQPRGAGSCRETASGVRPRRHRLADPETRSRCAPTASRWTNWFAS